MHESNVEPGSEVVTISRAELEALRGVVAAVERAHAERYRELWSDSIEGVWEALGRLYKVEPSLRPVR